MDMYIECALEEYSSVFYTELRSSYEEQMLDTGRYSSATISEVDDGRHEFIQDSFNEDYCYDPNATLDKKIERVPKFKERFITSLKAK